MGIVLLLDSAAVQAGSAVAIVLLTAALVWTTLMYVRKTGDMVIAMQRSNSLQERNLERILRAGAPSLCREDGGQPEVTSTEAIGYITLKNTSEQRAFNVVAHTDWGDCLFDDVGQGRTVQRTVKVARVDEHERVAPVIETLEFTDRTGIRWIQVPGSLPEVAH